MCCAYLHCFTGQVNPFFPYYYVSLSVLIVLLAEGEVHTKLYYLTTDARSKQLSHMMSMLTLDISIDWSQHSAHTNQFCPLKNKNKVCKIIQRRESLHSFVQSGWSILLVCCSEIRFYFS